MLDILTPYSLFHRRSLKVDDIDTLVATPALWLSITATGTIENITDATAPLVAKMCMSALSSNKYESQDVRGGRVITVVDGGAVVAKIDTAGYCVVDGDSAAYTYTQGLPLRVAYESGAGNDCLVADLGKLMPAATDERAVAEVETIVGDVMTVKVYPVSVAAI